MPAFGEQVLGRACQQQQEGAPRLRVGAAHQPQFADQVAVQQVGQLGDGRIRSDRRAVVDQQAVGQHGDGHRAASRGACGRVHQARRATR